MKREIELRRRLRALDGLSEAVRAMKGLSAHHFLEARAAIAQARTYGEGVERIWSWSGATLMAGSTERAGLLVIGAELGLCGSYNAHVVEAAADQRAALGHGPTFCVGHRAARMLARRGIAVLRSYAGPTSIAGITGLLLPLAEEVLTTYASEQLARFDIASSRFAGVGTTRPTRVRLLPAENRPTRESRRAPYVRKESFAFAAMRELLYVMLYDTLLDALASEHGARLLATQSAEKWLSDQSTRLRRHLTATRREASTQEMIEMAVSAQARAAPSKPLAKVGDAMKVSS